MQLQNGTLTISLDFELNWGLRDKRTIQEYEGNLKGVENAIARILELFEKYEIHATWATVGFIFAKNVEEVKKSSPEIQPKYCNVELNPYRYIDNGEPLEARYHFSPELIDTIREHKYQEIGTAHIILTTIAWKRGPPFALAQVSFW